MNRHPQGRIAAAAALVALTLVIVTMGAGAQDSDTIRSEGRKPTVVPLKDARLKIELNATDGDAGVQAFIDADPWKTMQIFDPHGRLIYTALARGILAKQGGTELFLESGEPSFSELPLEDFLERFPEGKYRIVGTGLQGEKLVGVATFTHNLANGPELVSPEEDAVVDPNDLEVEWEGVEAANGSPIVGYQVLVVRPNSGIPAIPKIILDVMMPPTATSMEVPSGFLLPDSEYEWEVLAIESGGNQTLSVGHFRTRR